MRMIESVAGRPPAYDRLFRSLGLYVLVSFRRLTPVARECPVDLVLFGRLQRGDGQDVSATRVQDDDLRPFFDPTVRRSGAVIRRKATAFEFHLAATPGNGFGHVPGRPR